MPSATGGGGVAGIRIEVDPRLLIGAGESMTSLGKQFDALMGALGPMLSSGITSGWDPAGLNMALEYGDLTQTFSDAVAAGANSFKFVGIKLQVTGHNYANADAVSTIGGGGATGGVTDDVSETTPVEARHSPNAGIVAPPPTFGVLLPFLGPFAWPTGNPPMLRLTAAQWRNLATGFSALSNLVKGAKTAVSTQRIPERDQILQALDDLADGAADLSTMAQDIATKLEEFAQNVQDTQDAVRRLLDRLTSAGGIIDTVKGIFTGEGLDIIKEVARDVREVLENSQRQVKGLVGLLEQLKDTLNDTVTKFQKWADRNLRELLGDQVGGAISDFIKFRTDVATGVLNGVINTVAGTVAFADLDTWKGIGETALSVIRDPTLIDDVGREVLKEFVAWDQWTGDNPGRGLGEAGFNVANLFAPGGPLAKGGTVAKGITKARKVFGKSDTPSFDLPAGRQGADPDRTITGTRVPDVLESPQNRIPDSVVDFNPPHRTDDPSHQGGTQTPVRPPDPPAPRPDNPGASGPVGGGDGPPPDPPQRPVGPGDPGPTHSTSPPVGDSVTRGNPADAAAPPRIDHIPERAADPAMPAAPHERLGAAEHSVSQPVHDPVGEKAHTPTQSPTPHGGAAVADNPAPPVADAPAPPAEHHRPATDDGYQRPTHSGTTESSPASERNSAPGREAQPPAMAPMMASTMGGPVAPPAPHTPGVVHGGGESHSPAARSTAPDMSTRSPEQRTTHPGAAGPAPGSTPAVPTQQSTVPRAVTDPGDAGRQLAPRGESAQTDSVRDVDRDLSSRTGDFEYNPRLDENGHYVPGRLPSYQELLHLTRTEPDTAHYWSGRDANGVGVGPSGSGIAERIAENNGGTTLEMLLERNGVSPLPAWNRHDPESVRFWEDASAAYAQNARGNVTAVIGVDLRPGNIWQTVEIPRLVENPAVNRIIQINPDTGGTTELFARPPSETHVTQPARDGSRDTADGRDLDTRADNHHTRAHDEHQPPRSDGRTEDAIGSDNRYKLSGHGDYFAENKTFRVPEGTSLTVYAEHGSQISNSLGNLIESGGDTSRVFKKTYYPGEEMPNYTLFPPADLTLSGTPRTVDRPTTLSELLKPNMGAVDFAACLGYWDHRVFDVHGIYHRDTKEFLHKYPWPEVDDDDNDW